MKNNRFFNRDVVSIKDFQRDDLEYLFKKTDEMKKLSPKEKDELGKARIMGYLFYEPSTRTRMSFEAAMASIGGSSIGISDLKSSSIEKGESLQDTVRVMDLYSDIIILRHQLDGSSKFAAEISDHPIINGGSGSEEHPTQAMLDLYTMMREKKDRKSTRLNSSHLVISYAVFCLKKKKRERHQINTMPGQVE